MILKPFRYNGEQDKDHLEKILMASMVRNKALEITVRPWRETVSAEQHRYYFGVVIPFCLEAIKDNDDEGLYQPWENEDMDAFLRKQFYFKELPTKKGMVKVVKTLRFTKASMNAVAKYMDNIAMLFAKMGYVVPVPDDLKYKGGSRL